MFPFRKRFISVSMILLLMRLRKVNLVYLTLFSNLKNLKDCTAGKIDDAVGVVESFPDVFSSSLYCFSTKADPLRISRMSLMVL